MKLECTLTNEELIERANEWVHKLAKSGGRAWSLQVPVNFNSDPDMLFVELAKRLKAAINTRPDAMRWVEVKSVDDLPEGEVCGKLIPHKHPKTVYYSGIRKRSITELMDKFKIFYLYEPK